MATEPNGNIISNQRKVGMTADYGQRAAFALNRCATGPNADKIVAGAFGISVRMARYLRSGLHWTTERLTQASRAFKNFDAYLAAPDQLHTRLDELEQELADLRSMLGGGRNGR